MHIVADHSNETTSDFTFGWTTRSEIIGTHKVAQNLVIDLEDAGSSIRYLIRDRDGKFCALFDEVLADAGIQVVLTGVRMPRMNAVMEPVADLHALLAWRNGSHVEVVPEYGQVA